MRLIILGTGAAYPGVGQASSGYLIEDGENYYLIDCGTGVLSNLFRWMEPEKLKAILISHLHTDHFLDLYPLRYYLQYTAKIDSPVKVLTPEGGAEHISKIVSETTQEEFLQIYSFKEIGHDRLIDLNKVVFQYIPVKHSSNSYGIIVGQNKELFYTGDMGYEEAIIEEISGVKTILSEATSQEEYGLLGAMHMTARQAGLLANQAGAERLILTHIWPSFNQENSFKEASKVFRGEVIIAKENQSFEL